MTGYFKQIKAFQQRQLAQRRRQQNARSDAEHQEQKALIQIAWMHRNHPAYSLIDDYLYAIPNGANCEQVFDRRLGEWTSPSRIRLVAEGMRRGYPDLGMDLARGGYHGLKLEMKSEQGKLSPDQEKWRERLIAAGYCWALRRSASTAWSLLCDYLDGKITTSTPPGHGCT